MVSLCLEEEMVRINKHFLFNYRKIKLLTRERGAASTVSWLFYMKEQQS
jgi:hypothetical protein